MEPNVPCPTPDAPSEPSSTPPPGAESRAGRYFLLTLFVLALVAFIWVIKIFLLHIVVAAVFATLFYPLQRRLAGWLKGRQGLAAAFSTLVILLALLIPISFVMNLVIRQAIDVYHTFQPKVQQMLQEGDTGPLGELKKVKTQMTFGVIVDLFIVLFTIFYFLRDGRQILGRIQNLLPLSDTNKQLLASRFAAISRATVKGTLVIALIQGTLGGLTLLIFGFDNWLLWGVVMVVLAALPMVGTGLVLIPSGIYRIVSGDVWQGVAVILVSVLVVSTIDNFLRPRLVGRDVQMHDLLILFSTIGGIAVFGIMGFIIGPMVVALFLTILDIFSLEYMHRAAPVPPAA